MKKILTLLLAVVMAATLLAGCGGQSANTAGENSTPQTEKKEKVVVACWGNQMLDSYTQYLCDLFPEVEFEFVLATNSTDYYRFRADHDDMPDILTVRRFALKDAVLLKDYLYDLSNTELANTYYGSYLDSYTYDDGTVNWLPTCAEVDSFIINKTLFDEYNVPIPTDYESFIAACEAFEAVGIRGYVSDFAADYTCMEVLQGVSIPVLQSIEGRKWRQQYESGATQELSGEVWLPVFENFFDFMEKVGLGEEDADLFVRVEFLHQLCVGFFWNVEALEERAGGGFRFIAAHFAELGFKFDGFHAFVFGHFRLGVKFFAALADLVKFRVAHHDRVENGMFFVGEVILLQNRKTFVRVMGDVSRVRFEFSGKDLQERGLSGTVCTDNSIAITLAEREVDIFEKHAASILQTNIRNIEHGAKDSNYSERLIIQASRMRHISSGE